MRLTITRKKLSTLLYPAAALAFLVPLSLSVAGEESSALTVIRGYEGTQDYADAASTFDEEALVRLYRQHVTSPYREACSGEGDQFAMSRKYLETAIRNTQELSEAAAAIEENDVDSLVLHWIEVAQQVLPIPELTICIFPYSPDDPFVDRIKEQLSGNMGFVERGGLMWTQFIPAEGWLETLPHMVLHEYHHAVRYFLRPEQIEEKTLLRLLVSEGGANAFALSVRPEGPYRPWATLTEKQQAEVWADMQEHLDSTDPAVLQLFIFGDGKRVPRFSGYTIGQAIATSFIKNNPGVTTEEWSAMPADEFLALSGYAPGQ